MEITTKTTVTVTDGVGRELVSVSRTERIDAGGNPRFFLSKGSPAVIANAETAVVNAARALDHARVPADVQ